MAHTADVGAPEVIAAAVRLAQGDHAKAEQWFNTFPLPEFGGQTAAQAVSNGRGADVLRLLELYDLGSLG